MDVTLQWDANIEPNRAGYRIYYDTDSGPPYEGTGATGGDSPIDVKIADVEAGDTARYTVTGLNDDETYFFAVTAYNTSGNESGYSNEVSTGNDIGTGNESANSGGSGCFISTLESVTLDRIRNIITADQSSHKASPRQADADRR